MQLKKTSISKIFLKRNFIFSFKGWNKNLYLDCDCGVSRNINVVRTSLTNTEKTIKALLLGPVLKRVQKHFIFLVHKN